MDDLLSLACLAIGGLLVAAQVFAGVVGLSATPFLQPKARGAFDQVKLMAAGFSLAIPFLAAGGWIGSGNPWLAIGKTLLAGAALGSTGFIILLLPNPDPSGPKDEELDLMPGLVNLMLIVAAGVLLWTQGSTHSV